MELPEDITLIPIEIQEAILAGENSKAHSSIHKCYPPGMTMNNSIES